MMSEKDLSAFNTFARKLASSRFGGWLSIRMLHHVDRMVFGLTSGRTTLSRMLTGLPEVMLTTVGARSGQQRTSPLACIRDKANPEFFAVIASNWGQDHHPGWYYNLKAHPHARCSFGEQSGEFVAHEAVGDEYEKFWRYAVDTYYGYELYKQRAGSRHIPIMVMVPIQ
jgi:deazaflavin-dependent oxidoreductase (nitroreductase family)